MLRFIFFIIVFAGSLLFMNRVKETVPEGQFSKEGLTKNEKGLIWLLSLLNPIVAGAVFYYGWKKRLPVKSKQANRISLQAFLIIIVSIIVVFVIFALQKAYGEFL